MQSIIRLNIAEQVTQTSPQMQTQTQQTQTRPVANEYKLFRQRYRQSNFVPEDKINYIIQHHFGVNSGVIYEYSTSDKLLKIKVSDLLSAPIFNWGRNREPDPLRIPKIAKDIFEKRQMFKTLMYLNYNFKTDKFEIIDGLHRYLALNLLKSLNLNSGCTIQETEWYLATIDMNWLYNSELIIYCSFHSTEDDLKDLRENINCSQPMEMVLREDNSSEDLVRINIINTIADEWQKKYRRSFSSGADEGYMKTYGLTNRMKFLVMVSNIYDTYNININHIGLLKQILNDANQRARDLALSGQIRCSEKTKQRCQETGCYLFNRYFNIDENI